MRIKKSIFFAITSLLCTTSFAYQELLVLNNNSNAYVTAKAGFSPCSSLVDKGVVSPHSSLTVPQMVADLYCKPNCKVEIYANRQCGGKSVATASVDYHTGVTGINNHDTSSNHYHLVGSGYNLALEEGGSRSLFDIMFG